MASLAPRPTTMPHAAASMPHVAASVAPAVASLAPAATPRTRPTASRTRITASLPRLAVLVATAALAGCNLLVLNPSGDIAAQQGRLVVVSTWLMLIIIIPVILLTVLFAWRYRASNRDAPYEPDWDHSIQLELLIWAAPLVIIMALGALTWISTHTLDPYRPLSRIGPGENIPLNSESLRVQVVALDWKWLFIYPEHGIAVVNEVAAPVDHPIRFEITASSVMNSFYVPALAGMIYAMPGMETKLHAVINQPGDYEGFSANYSGAGFSGMRFRFHGLDDAAFEKWVAEVKASPEVLDRERYLALERPSSNDPVRRFGKVSADLYDAIVNRCVPQGARCLRELAAIDAHGGLGPTGQARRARLLAAGALELTADDICRSSERIAPLLLAPEALRAAPARTL